jgi:hypothetical protein
MRYALGFLVLLVAAAGCATAGPSSSTTVGPVVAVLPPNNRTGDRLLVAGTGLIERYVIHADQVTVPDVLFSEARFQLQQKGFDVTGRPAVDAALKGRTPTSPASAAELASAGGLKGLVLYLELRRWEGDAPMHTSFVIVGLQAILVDPTSGKIVWQANHAAAPVATPGEIRAESAYVTAARKVIEQMLAPLRPASSVETPPRKQ